jgi:hypothetical protein
MSESLMPDVMPAAETTTARAPAPLPLAQVNAFSNQQLIDAFFDVANQLHEGDYQGLLARAGLDLIGLAADRHGRYTGPTLTQLPNLTPADLDLIHQSLIDQLQRRSTRGIVNTADGLNLRATPGRAGTLITSLPFGTGLTLLSDVTLDEEGEWLLVTAGEVTGWVFAEMVDRNGATSHPDTTLSQYTGGTTYSGPLEPSAPLTPPPNADAQMVAAAKTWNQYGGLIEAECRRLQLDPAVAVAILGVESAGRAFADGRMIIRFENHIFLHYWGQRHRELFDRHFTGSTDGNQHRWRPDANGEWLPCHTNQATEWQVFEFARSLDEQGALFAISMGAAQIMGFNHATVGFPTAQAMFAAFQSDVRHQLSALFRFIEVNRLQDAMRRADFVTFARTYNGRGQEDVYAPRMQRYYDAFRQLRPERIAGTATATGRLPQPGVPDALRDPELLAMWRNHVATVFANNETVFQQLLQGFLRPYWTTVWMYRILFALGVISFLLAAGLAIFTGRTMAVFTFGGLSAIALLGYFFNRPLQALEQNLQFLTWLGIVYNSYWTRLTLLNDERTVQADIEDVTDDAIKRIQALVAEHAERSRARPQLRLPFGEG